MVHENTEAGLLNVHALPEGKRWPDLSSHSGHELLNYYRQMLFDLPQSDHRLIAP